MIVEFFGAYNREYPRNAVFRKGLELNGVRVIEHHVEHTVPSVKAYPSLIKKYLSGRSSEKESILFVPEFNHRIIPLAWIISKISGKKLIFDPLVSMHDSVILNREFLEKEKLSGTKYHLLDRLGFKLPDKIISDTKAHKDFYMQQYKIPPEKIIPVPVGADNEIFNKQLDNKKESKEFIVLFYAKCTLMHGIEYIYGAASILQNSHPEIIFHLTGSGPPMDIIKKEAQKNKAHNAIFNDPVPLKTLVHQIINADIVLGIFGLTDKAQRVIPNKVIQSLLMEKAVLTMDSSAIREQFIPGTHLYTCQAGNSEELADAILTLYRNKALRDSVSSNGYAYAMEHLTPPPLGKQLIKGVGSGD